MAVDLPMVARGVELSAVVDVLESAAQGRGEGVLISGEAGIGKTRLLREARAEAERRGLLVLRGRAVESGGAYRPLVEAFARPAAPFAGHVDLAGVRPTLARVLPGWVSEEAVLAPMADPAAVLAEALMLLLETMAPKGAALILDDVHWADAETLSVLASLADAIDTMPLALVLAARREEPVAAALHQLGSGESIRMLPLRRLTPSQVEDALRASQLQQLTEDQMGRLVAGVDGLPLILDELVRQIRASGSLADRVDVSQSTLASAVQLRLDGLPPDCRLVLDAFSVLGDTDAEVLTAATGLVPARLGAALHAGLKSTLLVKASTVLGVAWRHILMRNVVRDLLLPLEQQAIAGRAADQLAQVKAATDGQLRQVASLYEMAGHPHLAAQQLIRAARLAVANAALDVAQQYLTDAQTLTGNLPDSAQEVLIERMETLNVAGRAADAYDSGVVALREIGSHDSRRLIVATARAAYAAGRYQHGPELVATLERESESVDAHLAVLRAQAALAGRRAEAEQLGEDAANQAQQEGQLDLACEALVIAGIAARRVNTERADAILRRAIELSQQTKLAVWEVRAYAELGVIDITTASDPTRLEQARKLATTAGMVGTVAELDMRIGETMIVRQGYVATYPIMLRAATKARQLGLTALHARTFEHLLECILVSDQPIPGATRPPGPADIEAVLAEAASIASNAKTINGPGYPLGVRAWLQGDNPTAIRLIEERLAAIQDEVKIVPWWGFVALLHVVGGLHPDDAFGPSDLTGHHANWAARAFGTAVWDMRTGQPADTALAQAEHHLRHAPFWRHLLRTVVAPVAFEAGNGAAEGWLREADSFYSAAGERPLQRRVRHALATIGAKVPRMGASVPPHLARLGITAREAEILRLVNTGLSNTDIAGRLFISTRTVETHVSSMLQKTGSDSRDQLPSDVDERAS